MLSIMSYLVGTGNLVFDAICATYCVEGNISAFSTVLARFVAISFSFDLYSGVVSFLSPFIVCVPIAG